MSYLRRAVREDRYYLACRASDGSECPVHETGHVFAGFFIADAVAHELSAAERQKLIARLDAEIRDGVWGYMTYAPVDSDDTAFVLQTYRLLGRRSSVHGLLRFYDQVNEAFTTFDRQGTASYVVEPSVDGNYGIHPEVNANIYRLLARSPLSGLVHFDLIRRAQDAQGWWNSYFYPRRYYATALNLELLCKTNQLERAKEQGLHFLKTSQKKNGSWGGVYDTALALRAIAACGVEDETFDRGIRWLMRQQQPDGSWRDEDVVVWQYTYQDSPPVIWRAYDVNGVVTTALSISVLNRSAQRLASHGHR